MSKLLLDEQPLQVLPCLATAIGLNEAIAVQQLHWVARNPAMGKEADGHKWVRMALDEWRVGHFPFWSNATIQRVFADLERRNLVQSRDDLNRLSFDRTKWYAIDYDEMAQVELSFDNNARIVEHIKMKNGHRKMRNASSQDETTIPESSLPESSFPEKEAAPEGAMASRALPEGENVPSLTADGSRQREQTSEEVFAAIPSVSEEPIRLDPLAPSEPDEIYLFQRINEDRALRDRRPIRQYQTVDQRKRFLKAIQVMNGRVRNEVDRQFGLGKHDLNALVNLICACADGRFSPKKRGGDAPLRASRQREEKPTIDEQVKDWVRARRAQGMSVPAHLEAKYPR